MNSIGRHITPVLVPIFIADPTIAMAADATWQGDSSSYWRDTENWASGTLPTDGDTVYIDVLANGPPYSPVIEQPAANPTLPNSAIYIGNSSGTDPSLSISSGITLETMTGVIAGASGGTGAVTVSGSYGSNAEWTMSGNLYVGQSGTGTLKIIDYAKVSSYDSFLGYNAGSEGTATVSGSDTTWTQLEDLIVGQDGTGSLSILDGGTVATEVDAILGYSANAHGSVEVDGNHSKWTVGYINYIGVSGSASLLIEQKGQVSSYRVVMGDQESGSGTVTVDGADATLTIDETIYVGNYGSAKLAINANAAVSAENAVVGQQDLSDGTVTVRNAGALDVSGSLTVGLGGKASLSISESGTVSSLDAYVGNAFTSKGTVSVSGSGSSWIIGASDLYVGNAGNGTLIATDSGLAKVDNGQGTVNVAYSSGSTGLVAIGANSGDTADAPGTIEAATIQFGDGSGELVFNHTDTSGSFAFAPAVISGSGDSAILVESGYTALTGDVSGFTGTASISGGTLELDNAFGGSVTLSGSGGLSGTGTVAGDVTFGSDTTYLVTMDGTTDAQGLTITGNATLDGTLELAGDYASIAGMGQVQVLEAGNTLTTVFTDVTEDSVFLDPSVTYDNESGKGYVYVAIDQTTSFADLAETQNHVTGATAFDSLQPGDALYAAIALLNSEEAALDAYDQLSGEAHASLKGALVENSQQAVKAVNDRIHSAFEAGDANTSVSAYGGIADPADGFWMTGYGDWMTTDATGNTHAMDNDLYGVIAGIDHRFGEYGRLGILGGYSRTNTTVDALSSETDADSYTIGLYGGADNGSASLSLGALYTWHAIDSSRRVANPVSETLQADYDARSFQLFAEAGYSMTMDRVTIEPFAGVSYINLNTDAFSETGGIAALSSLSQTTSTTFTTLGLRTSIELASNISTRGMMGWRHAFGDVDPASTFTIGGSDAFTILGAPIARDAAVLETGIDIKAGENVTIGASYEGQYGDGAIANGFNARLLAAF